MKIKTIIAYFDFVLIQPLDVARRSLFYSLAENKLSEAQLCNSILAHSTVLKYNADQWFDFLNKVPNKILLRDPVIRAKLTLTQIEKLDHQF